LTRKQVAITNHSEEKCIEAPVAVCVFEELEVRGQTHILILRLMNY